ncbi:MAG: nitroreductase [Nitrospira bacterium SG8_35_4]|nr:MAG: nitroreductase [Nitrospira bacterium SG8_35_4]
MLKNLVKKNRSYRRFYQNIPVTKKQLRKYIDLARMSASAANLQPLKYILSRSKEKNALIFRTLAWAGYIKNWDGPGEGERPSAYIIVLGDTTISKSCQYDCGIAAQSILLGAVEDGLGGCIIGSIKRQELREALNIADRYNILIVLALGKPKEIIKIETAYDTKEIRYWRNNSDVHHVPKRPLEEIIIEPGGDS